jgi:hypothetical protein
VEYFRMAKATQKFDDSFLKDIKGTCFAELDKLDLANKIHHGDKVAVAAGSRGISEIDRVIRAVVDYLKKLGAEPFIIPAMGSHGGGTAEGQRKVLAQLSITEETMGVPLYSSMDAVLLDEIDGVKVYLDPYANKADHIFVVNRIKPHTLFTGEVESGLVKMMVIGLGKHKGALAAHASIESSSAGEVMRKIAGKVLQKKPNVYGLGIVENGYKKICILKALPGNQFIQEEPRLLETARKLIPGLPFSELDILIIDEIGKEISGSGMDPNVVGRMWHDPHDKPLITRIFVRDLTAATGGNATGIGRADFTTTRLVKSMDLHATYTNCLTSRKPEGARIPIYFDSDRQVLRAAINTLFVRDPQKIRAVWIKNTSHVTELFLSEALLPEAEKLPHVTVCSTIFELSFDEEGNLVKPLL